MTLGWPLSLPQNLRPGASATPNKRTKETVMDDGTVKIRLTHNTKVTKFTGEIKVTQAQADTFFDWYENDHLQGAVPFEWKDPFSGATKTFVITGTPQRTHNSKQISTISFVLQEMPS